MAKSKSQRMKEYRTRKKEQTWKAIGENGKGTNQGILSAK
jgi:hypothetical protein